MFLLWHPSLTAINLSYTFPILETSATALCGTTGNYLMYCIHVVLLCCTYCFHTHMLPGPKVDASTPLIRVFGVSRRGRTTSEQHTIYKHVQPAKQRHGFVYNRDNLQKLSCFFIGVQVSNGSNPRRSSHSSGTRRAGSVVEWLECGSVLAYSRCGPR